MRFFWVFPGLILVAIYGLGVFVQGCEETTPHRVVSCRPSRHTDGNWVKLRYDDGSWDIIDIWRLDRDCLAPGTLVEKRRWELGWRLDGGEPMTLDAHSPGLIPIFLLCCGLTLIAFVYSLVKRE